MKVESAELFLMKSVEGRLESSGIEEVGGALRLMLAMCGPPFLTPALEMPLFAGSRVRRGPGCAGEPPCGYGVVDEVLHFEVFEPGS